MTPFPFLEALPEGLALTLSQGRLYHLQKLDLSRYGFWRFLRHAPHRMLLVSAVAARAVPRLKSLALEDEDNMLILLREAFQGTAAWQPPPLPPLVDARGFGVFVDDDNDEQGEKDEEEGDGRHPHRHRQAVMKRLVVRNRDGNYGNILALLQVPLFSRLQSLEIVGGGCHYHPVAHIDALATYIRSSPGFAVYLRSLTINLGLTITTLDPLSRLLSHNCPPGLTHLNLTNLRAEAMQEFGEIYLMGGLATLTTLHVTAHEVSPEAMKSWMEGVLASKHRGAALKELEVSYCAAIEIIHALERGAFPQLERLSLCLENMDLLRAFVVAMGNGGAPCTHTLRQLDPVRSRCRRDEYVAALWGDLDSNRWPKQGLGVTKRCLTRAWR